MPRDWSLRSCTLLNWYFGISAITRYCCIRVYRRANKCKLYSKLIKSDQHFCTTLHAPSTAILLHVLSKKEEVASVSLVTGSVIAKILIGHQFKTFSLINGTVNALIWRSSTASHTHWWLLSFKRTLRQTWQSWSSPWQYKTPLGSLWKGRLWKRWNLWSEKGSRKVWHRHWSEWEPSHYL